MFCPNCGIQLSSTVNFCPNCGTKVVVPVSATKQDNMVMLLSLGSCARTTAAALLQQVCGYAADDALLIVDSAPITVARSLTEAQARYLAQAFAEYGLEVSVYDGDGWRDWESSTTSVWDSAGDLITGVAAALGLIGINNRVTREMMRRTDFPYRFAGTRPPVYRLNSTLRAVPPRRVAPVRPPVHRAPPPIHPAPPRPAPARPAPPPRPAPQPPHPATRPAPQPPRPPVAPKPAPHPMGGPVDPRRPGGGRPGGGAGRQGGPGGSGGPGRPGR